jgi:serine/threonine protein kinase
LPPSPWLHLEYVPEGSISDHLHAGKSFDERECKQILAQSSDALAYLHSQDPWIVHRDVKPSNMLILHRRPGDLFIKFADFGISRESDTLKTICGTYAYLAPEVYEARRVERKRRAPYTALVDVWSLGVVLARLLCGLPKQEEINVNMGVEWCESICERVERALRQGHRQGRRQDLLSFVLKSMLCLNPADRGTAAKCHKEALRLLFDSNSVPESDNDRGEADDHHQHQKSDTEASTILAGKADESLPSLSRYIVDTDELLGRRQERSCRAPSPETVVPLHAGQLLKKLRNPQDSLFYNSSFGEDSDPDSGSDCSTSAPATVIIARETVVELQTQEQEDRLSDALIREALGNSLNHGTGATLSVKRPRPASR